MKPGRATQLKEKPPGQDTEIEVHDPVVLTDAGKAKIGKIGQILSQIESGSLSEAEGLRQIEEISAWT